MRDSLQTGKDFFAIAVLYAVGVVGVVNGIGGETRGDNQDIARVLCIIAELQKTIVGIAIVLAWLVAESVDDDYTLLLQLFKALVQLCRLYADHMLSTAYQRRDNLLAYQRFSNSRITEAQQSFVVVVGEPADDMVIAWEPFDRFVFDVVFQSILQSLPRVVYMDMNGAVWGYTRQMPLQRLRSAENGLWRHYTIRQTCILAKYTADIRI